MKFFVEEMLHTPHKTPAVLFEWAKLSGQTVKFISRRATMLVLFDAYSFINKDFVLRNF